MKIQSAFLFEGRWVSIVVEVALLPGLAGLHVLGPVSKELKDCLPKMKAAFRAQKLDWPRTKHVVVYIHSPIPVVGTFPELAIAFAVLNLTGQIHFPLDGFAKVLGELELSGGVRPLSDKHPPLEQVQEEVFGPFGINGFVIQNLSELKSPKIQNTYEEPIWRRPKLEDKKFSDSVALLIAAVALGEHPLLLAGPPGTGKTTVMDAIYQVLPEVNEVRRREILTGLERREGVPNWRPKISPHHSASSLALMGGGVPPRPGEVAKAHGGVLILDEYLQFRSSVQEALREPVERGELRISRGSTAVNFAADFILLAATNLCPCGKKSPGVAFGCGRSLLHCQSHIHRLSGPMLDRFQIVALTHQWGRTRQKDLGWILAKINEGRKIQVQRRQKIANARLSRSEILETFNNEMPYTILQSGGSERRDTALLRVARTVADLEGQEAVMFEHLSLARTLATEPHFELEQNML